MEQEEILEASMKDLEQAAMGKGLENTETQGQVRKTRRRKLWRP